MKKIQEVRDKVLDAVGKTILGKEEMTEQVLAAMFCGGHVLLNDVPGTGKTLLAKSIAEAVGLNFQRIQFTVDLMPTDLIGVEIPKGQTGEFEFRKGAVFTQILLADEINRGTPRTQSALLECMEERQVTVDRVTYALQKPFFVIATQNPVEMQGTFPLPEAQLDRFTLCLKMGYPGEQEELALLKQPMERIPVQTDLTVEDFLMAQAEVEQVHASDAVGQYVWNLTNATRNHSEIRLGLSTRGMLTWLQVAKAYAGMCGRDYVNPTDIQKFALPCVAHRLVMRGANWNNGFEPAQEVVEEILRNVSVPKEEIWN